MSKVCECCGKKPLSANRISFSHKAHKRRQLPNLQKCKVRTSTGGTKSIRICTSCLKADKVQRVY